MNLLSVERDHNMREIEKLILDASPLESIANDILLEAKKRGADQAEVGIDATKGFSVSAHGGAAETVEYHQDKSIEITVYFGKRSGSASLSDLRKEAIQAAVEAACHIAKYTGGDPCSGLPEKEDLAFNYPKLNLSYPWNINVDEAIALACECEKLALAQNKLIMSAEEVRVGTLQSVMLYANSLGFTGWFPISHHEISCVLIAKKDEEMQRDYSYSIAVDPNDLESIESIAYKAAERAVNRLGAKSLRTTKAPVIFIAEEARGLLGHFASAIKGSNLYRKASFLLDHLHQKVFPSFVHIQEHPHLPKALGSAPFDDEGVATRSNVYIDDGILQSYSLGVYSARKLGMHTTGNSGGVHNLVIKPGKEDLAGLLKQMDKGLLITELMGHGLNLLTGDYSRGAGGYWIENGVIQYPVHEVTVAGNLKDVYANLVAIGNDVDTRGGIRTGSLLIAEMTIAGQ